MMFWVGVAAMLALGIAMFAWGSMAGSSRDTNTMNVSNSSGTFINATKGDVNVGGASSAPGGTSGWERFLKWAGLAISAAALVVSIIKLFLG